MTVEKKEKLTKTEVLLAMGQWQQQYDQLIEARDELIRQGWEAGTSMAAMASLLHLSIPRLYQIKDGR